MSRAAWVGIDLGTQSVRVAAVAEDGATIASASAPLTSARAGARHEQDPESWWRGARDGLATVTAIARDGGFEFRGVSASGTSGTVVPVDERGVPTAMAAMYDDARGADRLEEVGRAGAAVWHRLGYRMQGSWALPTLLAMQVEGMLPQGSFVAHQPDVVLARLAGRRVATDTSHALKSGADLDDATWPADVMTALGLDLGMLPALVLPGTVLGVVSQAAAAETGLPAGCPLVAGMTDGCAAQIASGALAAGDWSSVLGTTLVLKGVAAARTADPTGAVYAHRAPFGDGWWPGGASSSGAGVIGQWLPGRDLEALTPAAARVVRPPLAYPLVSPGERFPFVAPEARAIQPVGDDAEVLAGIAMGVASVERLAFDLLAGAGHDVSGTISVTGGGSRNPWWVQLRADLLGRPLTTPPSSEGSVGIAMLAAAAVEEQPLAQVAARMLPTAPVVEPRASEQPRLLDLHGALVERWRDEGWLTADRPGETR